jgi:preprotein translocase subunit SecE
MAEDDDKTKSPGADAGDPGDAEGAGLAASDGEPGASGADPNLAAGPVQSLGATKYVHGSFFVVGVAAAYLVSKLLAAGWDALAAWPPAARAVPQLLLYGEDERPGFTLAAGGVVGVFVVLKLFKGEKIRAWADEVALELSKVVWPTREIVTNGTIVVIVASALATVYIGLLDRLWGFVTTLVYGA